jgi:hypothetical protein
VTIGQREASNERVGTYRQGVMFFVWMAAVQEFLLLFPENGELIRFAKLVGSSSFWSCPDAEDIFWSRPQPWIQDFFSEPRRLRGITASRVYDDIN